MRVALIHDWLLGMRGGEFCLENLCKLFPEAEIYTAFYDRENIAERISSKKVFVSSFNKLPFVRKYYRYLLPIFPIIACQLSFKLKREHQIRPYDFVISVSHCLAKNVSVPQEVIHVCYCLTPMRYIWDQFDSYFKESRLKHLVGLVAALLRKWDRKRSLRVNYFIAISNFISKRIETYYQRGSEVIYPPVDMTQLNSTRGLEKAEKYICVSALVPYKNVEIIVEAFSKLDKPLIVVGDGPEKKKLLRRAGKNVEFRENLTRDELALIYRNARAFVYAAVEDFGIAVVEAQAAGKPVICLARGGCLETVIGYEESPLKHTGVFFTTPSVDEIISAVKKFEELEATFSARQCEINAGRFSEQIFMDNLIEFLSRIGFNIEQIQLRQKIAA